MIKIQILVFLHANPTTELKPKNAIVPVIKNTMPKVPKESSNYVIK